MHPFLLLIVLNAGLAAGLAIAVALASRLIKVPALVHLLWLVVLARLVMPPLVGIPLLPAVDLAAAAEQPPSATLVSAATVAVDELPDARPKAPVPWPVLAADTAFWLFLAATLVGLLILAVRVLRVHLMLRSATPAPPQLVQRSAELARRLGLASCPQILLVPQTIPPCLWSFFDQPRILLPTALVSSIGWRDTEALVSHELVHYKRRDHWVRYLEALVGALFWWYPVAWWARRGLRAAEERCCDDQVVRTLPDHVPDYAKGLVATVEYLTTSRPRLLVASSGAAPARELKERLTMILERRCETRPRSALVVALLIVAAAVLAVHPINAQKTESSDPPPEPQPAVAAGDSIEDLYVHPSEVDTMPVLEARAPLAWPAGTDGRCLVVMTMRVEADGSVDDVKVVRDRFCSVEAVQAASAAVRGYRFRPATKDHRPVASDASVVLRRPQGPRPTGTPTVPELLGPVTEGDLLHPSQLDTLPVEVHKPTIRWPEEAAGSGLKGTIIVLLLVDETGQVVEAEVRRGRGLAFGLDEIAVNAAMATTYTPATRDGVKVRTNAFQTFTYDFTD